MPNILLSTSTYCGSYPESTIELLVDIYVNGVVIIFVPAFAIFKYFSAVSPAISAEVPEFRAVAYLVPIYVENFCSNVLTCMFSVILPLSKIFKILSLIMQCL